MPSENLRPSRLLVEKPPVGHLLHIVIVNLFMNNGTYFWTMIFWTRGSME